MLKIFYTLLALFSLPLPALASDAPALVQNLTAHPLGLFALVLFVAAYTLVIFEEQLNGWYRVPSVWPEKRDLNAFLQWFECSFHSMVIDVCDERLRHTDM